MAHDLFVDKLFIADSIYVVFGQKSVGSRFLDNADYIKVENEAEAVHAGAVALAQDGTQVKAQGAPLSIQGSIFVNDFDAVNVLLAGQDFELELSLLEKMPVVKTKRIVQTTFSNNIHWA